MSGPLLDVRDLTVALPRGRGLTQGARASGSSGAFEDSGAPDTLLAVDDVSFEVRRGEALALVGESGSGKTTLGRALLNLVPSRSGRVLYQAESGGQIIDVLGLRGAGQRRARRELQIVFQDPRASLNPRHTAGRIIGEALGVHGLARGGVRERRVERLLERVGLGREAAQCWPHEFSGGERQRISIARALALEPRFIVLDEVTSALDVSVQAEIVNLLADLKRDLGLSYLLISHDLSLVNHVADRVLVMTLGRIVERGTTEEIFEHPAHPYTRALLASRPHLTPGTPRPPALVGEPPSPLSRPAGCSFHPRCPEAVERCHLEDPREAVRISAEHACACHLILPAEPPPGP